ncbi:hypothetical protein JRO89_XS09G0236300 [Xanthoceras sorbifolium]|uniref:Protein kinase domain-containing protein n=1 Tax=Xanthoceras sorbifolium TaxID=99658 RepID=A0ABQ8HMQ8_9ROSI|nr:hypothetical protein JRO89_XS09G0236300 [Xanthoceras sorbifolium]
MAVAWHWLLRPILLFSTTVLITFPSSFSIPESEALLKLKKSFADAADKLASWEPKSAPCINGAQHNNWVGVVCYNGLVTGLRLGNMGLSGKIDVDALVEMPGLRTISVVNNSFSGTIPEFNRLGVLKAVYLSGNQFSGEIPPGYFKKMESLKKVWLSNNQFRGRIPPSLGRLPHLIELHIENNQFSGTIPSFDKPTLMSIDFSNNKLEGEIPGSLMKFNSNYFSGNPGLCGKNLGVECRQVAGEEPPPAVPRDSNVVEPSSRKRDDSKKIAAAVIILSVMLLSIAIVLILRCRRKRKAFDVLEKENVEAVEVQVAAVSLSSNKKEIDLSRKAMSSTHRGSGRVKGGGGMPDLVIVNEEKGVFGLPDLMKAAAEVLGNGGIGSSYKVVMADGVSVAVKRMREMNTMGRDGFDAEIRNLSNLKHSNIFRPLGYHYRKDEKLIVYEYIPRGSLLYLLHGDRGPSHDKLNWPARLKIVQGIARGLGYLHTELAHLDLPHGNLKSSNIMLGPENEPLVSEYGFGPLISSASQAKALFAYKAPEAHQTGKASPKCDVYCLGIVILEILTGKYPSQYLSNTKGGVDVVQWVPSALSEGRLAELLDPEIASSTNSLGEMEQLLHIGIACTETNPEVRLDMTEAVRRILEIQTDPAAGLEGRTLQVLPTLRDGYGDSSQSSFSERQLGELSGRRQGSESFDER